MNDPRTKINLDSSKDLEGNRESADFKRGSVIPPVRTRPMPSMSDGEVYLRLNVPDGSENDGSYPTTYGIVQRAHANPSESPIKTDDGR